MSLAKLFEQLQTMNHNLSGSLQHLHDEIGQLRHDMVTTQEFKVLEDRVSKLERAPQSSGSLQINALKQQLNRLDPANKSVCIRNLKDNDVSSRRSTIEALFKDNFPSVTCTNIEHIFLNAPDGRKLSSMSTVEFSSRSTRGHVFK